MENAFDVFDLGSLTAVGSITAGGGLLGSPSVYSRARGSSAIHIQPPERICNPRFLVIPVASPIGPANRESFVHSVGVDAETGRSAAMQVCEREGWTLVTVLDIRGRSFHYNRNGVRLVRDGAEFVAWAPRQRVRRVVTEHRMPSLSS